MEIKYTVDEAVTYRNNLQAQNAFQLVLPITADLISQQLENQYTYTLS